MESLKNNTTELQEILAAVNALPSAGGGITPTGTIEIVENGTHDVTEYASATVNVPVGVFPSGTKEITTNGEHDVTNFEKVTVAVESSSGVTLPDGAVVVQKVLGAETSTQVASGYSVSITYGSDVEISDSLALAFVGSTSTLSNISASTDFSVLQGKYIRSGSTTTAKYYYIPNGSTFTVGGQSYSKTVTCDRAQSVTIQKVNL